MSQVHFKIPQVKSFFSQHDHFEYSQIAVKQGVEEALVTGDHWQVDGLRRELKLESHLPDLDSFPILLLIEIFCTSDT